MPNTFKFKDSQGRTIEGEFDRDTDTISFTRTLDDGVTVDLSYSGSHNELQVKARIGLCVSDTAFSFAAIQ